VLTVLKTRFRNRYAFSAESSSRGLNFMPLGLGEEIPFCCGRPAAGRPDGELKQDLPRCRHRTAIPYCCSQRLRKSCKNSISNRMLDRNNGGPAYLSSAKNRICYHPPYKWLGELLVRHSRSVLFTTGKSDALSNRAVRSKITPDQF
jgi:hypothetical protein